MQPREIAAASVDRPSSSSASLSLTAETSPLCGNSEASVAGSVAESVDEADVMSLENVDHALAAFVTLPVSAVGMSIPAVSFRKF